MRLILLFAIFRFDNKLLVDTKLDNALRAATQSRRFYFIKCNPYAPREDREQQQLKFLMLLMLFDYRQGNKFYFAFD